MTKEEHIKNLKELITFFENEIALADEDQWIEYGFDIEEGRRDVETFRAALKAFEGDKE